MSAELSDEEQSLLPFMKNDLYQKYYSVIVRHFPIKSDVGHRLVDVGLLTISDYKELHSSLGGTAGISLLYSLETKGDDSMATFYRVLVGARDERDVAVILRHVEEEAKRRRRVPKDSGICDIKSPSSSTSSLLAESVLPTSSFANRSTNFKVDLAIKHIKELREEIREIKEELETHVGMKQQLLGAVGNIEAQLHAIMQAFPPGQWPLLSELSSIASAYQTCPNSRRPSGEHQQQVREMTPEAVRKRRQSLPTTLHLSTDSKQQLTNLHTAVTLRDKLGRIAEEPMHLDTQPDAEGTRTDYTSNPVDESMKMSDEPTPDRPRQRRPATVMVKPFKAIFRKLSRSGE